MPRSSTTTPQHRTASPLTARPENRGGRVPRSSQGRPGDRSTDAHDRVRHGVIDTRGKVTLRVSGRLHHINIGTPYASVRVLLVVHDLEVWVVDVGTGELLRELVIDPSKDYQGNGLPPGPRKRS
jgi:hypothetical protein